MPSIAFVAPLPADQIEANRAALRSCWVGDRREAHQDSRRRAGIVREAVWIQLLPGEEVAVVYLEADDLDAAFTILGTSSEPFDRWFRERVSHVRRIALDHGFSTPEPVLDFDIDRI